MKIAFVVSNYPPRVGGVELHVSSLANHLAARGHEVSVHTLADEAGEALEGQVAVQRLSEHLRIGGVLSFPSFGTRRRLTRELREQGVDVVSVHTRFFPMSWVGLRAAHRAGIPVLHTEHGSDHVVSNSKLISIASRMVDRTLGRAVLRRADRVLGVSENVRAFVRRLAGRDSVVFYNAIEAPEDRGEITQRPGHLVFVGRIVPGKGWETFIDLIERLRVEGRAVTGEMLGDGEDMPSLRERVTRLGLADAISVRGRVDSQTVREALAGAVLVNPTVLAEGFQTTLLEALAERGSVVTYPVPGAQALAAEGRSVFIAQERSLEALHEAMREMLEGADSGRADPPPIDAWTWNTRALQYEVECRDVIEEWARRRAPRAG